MVTVCELTGVRKHYSKNVVLENTSISVCEGELIAITGRSGSGKTTILNLMGLLEMPDSGVVRLFGENLRIGSRRANIFRREKLGYLFQNFGLIDNASVEANLEISLLYSNKSKREKEKMKLTALEKVGLNTPLQKKVFELSGGEQQRIAFARILLKPCDLILADEPTGSLDEENTKDIMRIIREQRNSGKTVVLVTHDHKVAESCDRIIKL